MGHCLVVAATLVRGQIGVFRPDPGARHHGSARGDLLTRRKCLYPAVTIATVESGVLHRESESRGMAAGPARPGRRGAILRVALALGLAGMGANAATAQDFPRKPVTIIASAAPGGGVDLITRTIARALSEQWKQPVIVENKAGASGMIGSEQVMRAPPDGYTALVTITTHIQNPAIFAKMPYDPLKDFEPVSQICLSYLVLVVKPEFPANNLKEFIAHVKANPGKLSFGSFGTGSSSHIVGETFARKAGLDMAHVPYKGAAPMTNDLLGGQLSAAFIDAGTARAHIKSGGFKALAVTGTERLKMAPDAPVFSELGYKNFDPKGWFGFFVPVGTPAAVVKKLADDIGRAVRSPEITARIDDLGQVPVGGTPEAFAEVIRRDGPLYARLIKDLNIKLD